MNPKVYLIHASEDKERFVLDFAKKLRERGVDVWLDKWEMFPGDSLVDKMFEEGIKNANAFLIVLSNHSANKKWVKEELNASVLKKIENGSKIIPVVIEDCEIPEVLKSTLWQKINNLDEYDKEFERIIASIYGMTDKPELGKTPNYSSTIIEQIGGLNKQDNLVFKAACELAIQTGDFWVYPTNIYEIVKEYDISEELLSESLNILSEEYYINAQKVIGGEIVMVEITTFGFDQYVKVFIKEYDKILMSIISEIVNKDVNSNLELSQNLNIEKVIVDHVLNILEQKNYLKLAKMMGGESVIHNLSPQLKRLLNS